eukprot:CAMPEP_0168355542 /NCGR_PEP_ID=MMETSP0213-20121227/24622_1 /TAXON_ID=151035 /ORGANISM="Euplotes harpa, Strain FSP1.4" /LENGTH=30 /DNA_ID= /DNA_START= /DNA_END= /DNA_ORIENTATION=
MKKLFIEPMFGKTAHKSELDELQKVLVNSL